MHASRVSHMLSLACRRQLLKAHHDAVGPAVLYFGCRNSADDFLYETDLKGFAHDGTLNKLELAFSREGSKKMYVQHIMKEQVCRLHLTALIMPLLSDASSHMILFSSQDLPQT